MQPWRVACARAKRPWLGALGLERRPPSACTHVCAGFRVRWLACPAAQSASQVTSPARCTKLRLVVGNALHATPPPRGWAPAPAGLPAQTASPCFFAGGVSQPATPPKPSFRRQFAARGSTKPGLPRTEPHLELSYYFRTSSRERHPGSRKEALAHRCIVPVEREVAPAPARAPAAPRAAPRARAPARAPAPAPASGSGSTVSVSGSVSSSGCTAELGLSSSSGGRLRLSLRPLGLRPLLDLRPPTSAPAPAPTTGAVASARMARAR